MRTRAHRISGEPAGGAVLFTGTDAPAAAQTRDTRRAVAGLISRELARENLPAGTFGAPGPEELIIAATADRSVLGCMNDPAFLCGHQIAQSGGLRHADLAELN